MTPILPEFDIYAGIDWSGAKGDRHRGIAVAICEAGNSAPRMVSPPDGKSVWSRQGVVDWLLAESTKRRVFAGIDFAFAHPFIDVGAYYPDITGAPMAPRALWQMIDAANQEKSDLYGGGLWESDIYGPFYNAPKQRGLRFASRRRQTERAAASIRSPSPTFNCVGPAGVGTGSLAGMRLLHNLDNQAAIWPFDKVDDAALVLAEIFPSYYFAMAGLKPFKGAHGEAEFLNQGLAYFDTQAVAADYQATGPDADLSDAMISAAALRLLSQRPETWQAGDGAETEGWIFGVLP